MGKADRVVIVGGGLAGLAAGIELLGRGKEVTLFEAGARPGGCCTTTWMGGYGFNDGAMYVALPELLDAAFEQLGMDRQALLPLRQIRSLQTSRIDDGGAVAFGAGGRVTFTPAAFGADPTGAQVDVARLVERWQPLLDLLVKEVIVRPFSLATLLRKGWRELPKLRGTVADELERMVRDPAVRSALGAVTLYTGLAPQRTPVMQIIGLIAMLADRFYLPEGGMGRIPDVLASRFESLGGKLHANSRVQRILVENGRARGVLTAGADVKADAVLSTVSGMGTCLHLLDPQVVPSSLRRKARNAPLSQKALSIQLGLRTKIDTDSHFMARLPRMEDLDALLRPAAGPARWLCYAVPTVTMPELAEHGGSIIECYPGIDQAVAAQEWTVDRARGIADGVIELLSRWHSLDIAEIRVRSPREFQADLGLYAGAIYGLSPAASAMAHFPHKTSIEGLFLAGQTTYPGYGVALAMLSGIFAARAIQ
ncbi:MAG: NAD(P)/FAD-dependent oxidoreductase [Ramlibacter sp.]|nr:NAD(P)/FAD-dependent oxidoreductase [Ramlibacter sp.]